MGTVSLSRSVGSEEMFVYTSGLASFRGNEPALLVLQILRSFTADALSIEFCFLLLRGRDYVCPFA